MQHKTTQIPKRRLDVAETRIFKKGVPRKGYSIRSKERTIWYKCIICGAQSQKTHKLASEEGVAQMAKWHSKEKGGCYLDCKACGRKVLEERYPGQRLIPFKLGK